LNADPPIGRAGLLQAAERVDPDELAVLPSLDLGTEPILPSALDPFLDKSNHNQLRCACHGPRAPEIKKF